ncbi:unnamed protein product [Scytosiphon promiscuus]
MRGVMKVYLAAPALWCLTHSLPARAYIPAGMKTGRNPFRRAVRSSAMTAGGSQQQHHSQLPQGSDRSRSPPLRGGRGGRETRPRRWPVIGQGVWGVHAPGVRGGVLGGLGALFSSPPQVQGGEGSRDEGDAASEDPVKQQQQQQQQQREAAAVSLAADEAERGTFGGGDGAVSGAGPVDVVNGGEGAGGVIAGAGIGWGTLVAVVVSQLAFVGFFGWVASSGIREQVMSSFTASPTAAALGVAGMVPLLAFGLALDLRRDEWEWVKKMDEATSEVAVQLFGSERQVAKVVGVVIPLSMIIGVCEECAFRGLLPLIIAAKTGLPAAGVVVLSGLIFGSLHAATLAYFLTATISGMAFHGMLLSTGNIFVPIVAHAVYDAIALVRYHVKVTASDQQRSDAS